MHESKAFKCLICDGMVQTKTKHVGMVKRHLRSNKANHEEWRKLNPWFSLEDSSQDGASQDRTTARVPVGGREDGDGRSHDGNSQADDNAEVDDENEPNTSSKEAR